MVLKVKLNCEIKNLQVRPFASNYLSPLQLDIQKNRLQPNYIKVHFKAGPDVALPVFNI